MRLEPRLPKDPLARLADIERRIRAIETGATKTKPSPRFLEGK